MTNEQKQQFSNQIERLFRTLEQETKQRIDTAIKRYGPAITSRTTTEEERLRLTTEFIQEVQSDQLMGERNVRIKDDLSLELEPLGH